VKFGCLDICLITSDFSEYTKVHFSFRESPDDSKFGSMLTLKFPSHAPNILGGNGDGGRHGLLQGKDRGGVKKRQ
jgi:hypothetical protein